MARSTVSQDSVVFNRTPDFTLQNEGTVYLPTPLTDSAREWVSEHLQLKGSYQSYPDAVVIEHRFIHDIVIGIQSDGLAVQ